MEYYSTNMSSMDFIYKIKCGFLETFTGVTVEIFNFSLPISDYDR